jgi:hypothetical protein
MAKIKKLVYNNLKFIVYLVHTCVNYYDKRLLYILYIHIFLFIDITTIVIYRVGHPKALFGRIEIEVD